MSQLNHFYDFYVCLFAIFEFICFKCLFLNAVLEIKCQRSFHHTVVSVLEFALHT